MGKDIFDIIYEMIYQYEETNGEKPYAMLVSPKTYMELREYWKNTSAWKSLAEIDDDKEKIKTIFGVPIEISSYIMQEAICMNERDYKKYCEYRFTKNYLESEVN